MQGPLREEFTRISTRARSRENLQWTCRRPRAWEPGGADFVRACAVEMHMDIWQEQFYVRILREKAGAQDLENLALQTLCGPAQSWAPHKSKRENLQEKDRRSDGAPWSNPGLNTYRRNPQCGHTVWGKQPGARYHRPCQTHFWMTARLKRCQFRWSSVFSVQNWDTRAHVYYNIHIISYHIISYYDIFSISWYGMIKNVLECTVCTAWPGRNIA